MIRVYIMKNDYKSVYREYDTNSEQLYKILGKYLNRKLNAGMIKWYCVEM